MNKGLSLTEADKLLEAGKFREAKEEYLKNKQKTQAAYAAVLAEDIPEALELYLEVPHSAAKKWGLFLCDFLTNPNRPIPSPGVLSFRLYFEVTFSYCYRFDLKDYAGKFYQFADSLVAIYPEYVSDMDKVCKPDAL